MIIVQAPLRVSLFGGGTDFPDFYLEEGGAVLSTTIDKYIFVTAKWRFDHMLRVGYTKTELVDNLEDIEHELIRESFRLTGIRSGVEISTMGDIPSEGSGLGSSSTVTVGALLALHELRGNRVSTEKLAEDACRIELDILKKPIGIQDQYAAAFGGMRHIEFTEEGIVRLNPVRLGADTVRNLNENLLLFYTGTTRKSSSILEEQQNNIGRRIEILREMKGLVSLAKKEIEAGRLDEIGHMLHYTWVLKKRLASKISNPEIDELYAAGRKAGALGGKIIGAGGGGFLLLYCPNGTREAVRRTLSSLRELPFQLEPDGAKVILNYPRSVTTNDVAHETRQEFISVKSVVQRSSERGQEHSLSEFEPIKKKYIKKAENRPIMNVKSHLKTYAADVKRQLDQLPFDAIEEVIHILQEARHKRRRVFIMGNGGSASTATHFVCDLAKNTRSAHSPDYRAVGLSDNMALFSAYANDDGYSNVFRYQLLAQLEPEDVVIAISTSGNSENVVEAVRDAKNAGAYTIGFTGFTSGKLGALVDKEIHVDCDCIEQVEDLHLLLEHMIVHAIKELEAQPAEADSLVSSPAEIEKPLKTLIPSQLGFADSLPEQEKTSRAETLYRFSKIVADPRRSESLVRQLLQTAVQTFSATSGSLMLFGEGELEGEMLSYDGDVISMTQEDQFDVADQGLAAWVREQKLPALISNTRDDPRWLNRSWDEDASGPRSAMAIPFFHEGQVVGVLTLVRPYGFSFAEQEFAVFSAVSHCFSMYGDHILREGVHSERDA